MSFQKLQQSLIDVVHERIRNGEMTERHLAKLTGISQPHMHNVLKGARTLSPDLSDRILREMRLSVTQLCTFASERQGTNIPIIRDPVGPGYAYPNEIYCGKYPFAEGLHGTLVHPAVFRLEADPAMEPELLHRDVALVDRRQAPRFKPQAGSIYLVHVDGSALMRYARIKGALLYLGTRRDGADPFQWPCTELDGRDILEVIRGRIVWIGRQMETPARPAKESRAPVGPAGREG